MNQFFSVKSYSILQTNSIVILIMYDCDSNVIYIIPLCFLKKNIKTNYEYYTLENTNKIYLCKETTYFMKININQISKYK